MHVTRTILAAVLLAVAMIGVPLAAVAVATSVQPVIVAEPVPAPRLTTISALPQPPPTVRPLSTWFERLPIIDVGSGTPPRPFLAGYRALPAGDRPAALALVDVAFDDLTVEPSALAAARAFVDALTHPPAELEEDPDADLDAEEPDTFETPAFRALADRAMAAIAADSSNAQALNDLAVGIASAWFADPEAGAVGPETEDGLAGSPQLSQAATKLLELGLVVFPRDRAMTVNLAYLESLATTKGELDAGAFSDGLPDAVAGLESYLDAVPTDATAALLLANLALLTEPANGLDRATAIAEALVSDPSTEAAGGVVRADALLSAADRDRTRSPFLARSEALRALADYDRVIELTADPAAYAGRARTLDLLGSRDAAIEAQREALRLAPASSVWRLWLAQLESCGDEPGAWRLAAEEALATAAATKALPVVATRNFLPNGSGIDFGRYSIGSDMPVWDVTIEEGSGGALSISSLDPFPQPQACISGTPTVTSAVEHASMEVALAALAEDDLPAARAALAPWYEDPAVEAGEDGEEIDEGEQEEGAEETYAAATVLGLLAGDELFEDDRSIEAFMPVVTRLPSVVAARLCDRLTQLRGLNQDQKDSLTTCAAEAADRSGDHEAAARAIEAAVRPDDAENPTPGSTALKAGILSELTGDLDAARSRYETAATYRETATGALVRLGDLDLRENDASGALTHYALASATIRTEPFHDDQVEVDDALSDRLEQYVDNNRGIALLMAARTEDDAPPDCVAFEDVCREAADAFAAALAADPLNPIYPMNAAWVARLTGDDDRAITLLDQALEHGVPMVAAAHNDLGVLAARRGDLDGARTQFVKAIATDPEYDLATWNLGVLDSRQAGPMILAGQRLLAKATALNADLQTKPLTFLADERVYRVDVSGTELELSRAPGTGAAVGAAAFGAIAALGAIGQLIAGLGSDAQGAAETVASEGAGRAGRWLRGIGGRLPGRRRQWPAWVAWVPAIVVLTVTTAWTANWMAPDAFLTAVLIGLAAAAVAMVVHVAGHFVVAGRLSATVRPSGWTPGLALAVVGMPFYVPAGPFLAERIETGDPRRDWWVSFAGIAANLAAAGIAMLIYLAEPMPFLRILIATQLAVAAFALIPSHPLDGDRLSMRPIVLALMAFGVAAASTALAVGAI